MSAELTEIVYSISRAANTLVEFDTFVCLTRDLEDRNRVAERRVEAECGDLRDAAEELAQILPVEPALHILAPRLAELNAGIEQLSEGMRILAQYLQASQDEVERAARLVNSGYDAIDKVLRAVVEAVPVPHMFLPKHARMHHARAQLLSSLAERFTERLAAHAAH